MSETIIGIDLGTTNSEVAVLENDRPIVIGDGPNNIVPSYVGIADDGGILVGEAAKNQYALYPERTVKSIKRRMGSDERVVLDGKEYSPQEISAVILKRLKGMAEQRLGDAVSKAVITVPAYFNDAQRQATREAGEIAGLEVVRIINEPTAAALAYEVEHRVRQNVLVYDLGGGTFDVSVVRIEEDVVEVVASHGNNHLGGDDFDQRIIDHIVKALHDQHDVDARSQQQTMARITRAAEQAKCVLSDHPFAKIEEEYLFERSGNPVHLDLELSREDYEAMIEPYVTETLDAVHIALKGAELTVSDIDQILLVGGATRTPLVRRRLEEEFVRQPRGEVDPDLGVAIGAAIQAGISAGVSVSTCLVDITPYTFGTAALGEVGGIPTHEMFVPVIRKNSPIPVTKSELFYTSYDGQQEVDVRIYQGEDPIASNNIEIGNFRVEGLSDVEEGNPVLLRLSLDLNGVLHVTATEKRTGLEKSIKIDNSLARIGEEGIEAAKERIGVLFDGAWSTDEGSETGDSEAQQGIVQARALIEKAERLLNNASPEDKEDLVDLIESVNDAIASQNMDALKTTTAELADIIYYMEN